MQVRRCVVVVGIFLFVLSAFTDCAIAEPVPDELRQGFAHPPAAARPRTWWHWTGGNVSQEGITKDLEWMKRAGIAGFQLADVSFGGGQQVERPIEWGSPEWFDAVRHAAAEAERLDLEMAIFSSPGWSLTGGPWVQPEQAMKKLVWSETGISGPKSFHYALPQPPANSGSFQDIGAGRGGGTKFYRDVRVLAFRTPQAEEHAEEHADAAMTSVTSSGGAIEGSLLSDGSYAKSVTVVPPGDGGPAWVQYEFERPLTVRGVTIAGEAGIPVGRIAASEDGEKFHTLVTLPGAQLYRQGRVRTFVIPETTARFFRLEMSGAPIRPAETMSEATPKPAEKYSLLEWKLHSGARVHRAEEKAGFSHLFEYDTVVGPDASPKAAIDIKQIVDVTDKLKPDGTLDWEVPPGRWTVLRLGYSLTGARNRPAPPSGSGLEVDKLCRRHTEAYYDGYAKPIARALGKLYGGSLRYFLMDSWEAGQQNWTDDMIAEFTRRRGYDPTPYLPALTGRVVDNTKSSDRFLWDFRRTLADMFAENHYGAMREKLHADGLGLYSEAAGVSLEIPEDTLLNKSQVDIPMGEFWVRDLHPRLMYLQDVRGAASAAHAYCKPIVAAEAFTGGGYESPFSLKRASDYWLAQGINRLVFHTSAHQPLDTKPGNTMVGAHLHRNITWAEHAEPLNTYFARVCYLLQQGKPVVDVAYLLNEGAPSTMPIWGAGNSPACPEGYDHDFINADVLLSRLSVADGGRLVLPDGMSYRVLVLPETTKIRPELVEKLRTLVTGGATIVGPRPAESPSLSDQPAADGRVAELAEELWGDLNGKSRTIRHVGMGTVVWGRPLGEVLEVIGSEKDFEWAGPLDADLAWKHRRTENEDIYYVANLSDRPVELQTRFRVRGRQAELWRPDSGEISPTNSINDGDRTMVPLNLDPNETLFVAFRDGTDEALTAAPTPQRTKLADVSGEWDVSFPPGLGAPNQITISALKSWTDHEFAGVRRFSGTATYTIQFDARADWFKPGRRFLLNLGDVHDLAEVIVNGQPLGVAWKPPYRVDATLALRPGKNQLEIRVTNEWTNRLAGDRAAQPADRVLSAGGTPFRGGTSEPEISGLLGPVQIFAEDKQ
jgi:hypothetical protein